MTRWSAQVGGHRRTLDPAAPHVLERRSLRAGRGSLVEKHRYAEPFPNLLADPMRDINALVERGIFERHERHHVRGAHSRVYTAVLSQIDALHGRGDPAQSAFRDAFGRTSEGNDRTVVVGVHFRTQ